MNIKLMTVVLVTIIAVNPAASLAVDIQAPLIEYPIPVNNYKSQQYKEEQLKGTVVMVPAKTTFPAVLDNVLSSETAKVGDSVSFYLDSDFYYDNNLIAPEGSRINGSVVKVKKGSYGNIDGVLQVKFSNITTPSGQIIPVAASIETNDSSGVLKAGTCKSAILGYTKKALMGAAAGALFGTIAGALSGDVARGAITGTAIGGGFGLGSAIMEHGDDVFVPANARMNIILDQPVTFSSNNPF